MKFRPFSLLCLFLRTVLPVVFCAQSLLALDVFTKVELDGNVSVSLPMSWKVVDLAAPGTTLTGTGNSPEKPSSLLLLTAHPADSARAVSVSLFRIGLHRMGLPVTAGPMGEQIVLEDLLGVVLSQGFTPTVTKTTHGISGKTTPVVTAQIDAQNAGGEERIFTDTEAALPFVTLRLFSSRPATDQAAAEEIDSIIHSLAVPEAAVPEVTDNTTGTSPVSPPSGDTSPAEAVSTPQTPGGAGTPAPEISARAAQLTQDYHGSFLIVEGQKGVGSGFLCSLGGTTYAITNAHVLSDNSGVKLKALNGSLLTTGSAGIAVGHDIARISVQFQSKPLEIMTGIDENVKIGDSVLIPGNAEGAGVVKAIEGKVVGIGPNLIEVDAPFVKGNSGSPIIHLPSGKVLGVATYYTERKVGEGPRGQVKVETRRFGYRLDSVTEWEPVNWQRFYAQSEQVAKIWDLSEDFIHLFNNEKSKRPLSPDDYSSPAIQRAIREFVDATGGTGRHSSSSVADKKDALRRFFSDLKVIARNDIGQFDSRNAYDYFRRQVEDESRLRDQVQEVLTKAVESRMQ